MHISSGSLMSDKCDHGMLMLIAFDDSAGRWTILLKEKFARVTRIPAVALLLDTFREWRDDKTAQIAGSLAYFIMLSLAPLLIISVSIIGVVTDRNTVEGQVYDQVSDLAGESSANLVRDMVRSANHTQTGGIAALISGVTLVYGAINVFGQLQEALNRIWSVEVKQGQGLLRTIKRRSLAATMLPLTGVILLLSVILDTVLAAVAQFFGDQIPNMGHIVLLQGLSFVTSVVVITFLFAMIYKYLPDVNITWEDVFTGAAFTAVLFAIGQFFLSSYLTQSSVTSTYGAAGTFMVIPLWIYYSAQIFLFGAEFTQVYARRRDRRIEPAPYAYRFNRHALSSSKHAQQST